MLYARSASGLDDWAAVTAQLHACRRLADRLQTPVSRVFFERGVSGLRADRPALLELLAYVETHGDVGYVICADVDRLSRSYPLFEEPIMPSQTHGVLVTTVQDAVERYPALAASIEGSEP